MEEVFAATGLERTLVMARFLRTASPAELAAVIDRNREDRFDKPDFTSLAWARWVEIDRGSALRHDFAAQAWTAWARQDRKAALAAASKEPSRIFNVVLCAVAGTDPGLARKILAQRPEMAGLAVFQNITRGLMKRDPPAGLEAARHSGAGYQEFVMRSWLRTDPEDARAWIKSAANPALRRRMEEVALTDLITADPAAGLKELAELPASARQTRHTAAVIQALAGTDPAAARAAAEGLPGAWSRAQALAALAGTLASRDPAATIALIPALDWNLLRHGVKTEWTYPAPDRLSSISGTSVSGEVETKDLVAKLMTADPQGTAAALAALPEEAGAPVSMAVGLWLGLQPEAASAWLRDQPAGPARENGIQGLTRWLAEESAVPDFPAALAWAQAAAADRRFELLQRTLAAWQKKDLRSALAAASADTLPVTPEQRALLLKSFPSPP